MSTTVTLQLEGLDGVLSMLKSLPPEIVSKRGGPVLQALRAGAKLIRDQARANFRTAVAQPGLSGQTSTTGFTEKLIVSQRWRTGGRDERVVVTVRDKYHPSGGRYRTRRIRTRDIARNFEYSSRTQPAIPWLRPAFNARARESIYLIERELLKAVARAARKAAKLQGM